MTRTIEISNSDKVIDSRDVIARIAELEDYRDAAVEALDTARKNPDNTTEENEAEVWTAEDGTEYGWTVDWDEETEREYRMLKALEDEASGSPDWRHGETLIAEHYFEDYARELADDIGAIDKDAGWPMTCIDWEQAADALKQDYTSVDFDGETYWIRA